MPAIWKHKLNDKLRSTITDSFVALSQSHTLTDRVFLLRKSLRDAGVASGSRGDYRDHVKDMLLYWRREGHLGLLSAVAASLADRESDLSYAVSEYCAGVRRIERQ